MNLATAKRWRVSFQLRVEPSAPKTAMVVSTSGQPGSMQPDSSTDTTSSSVRSSSSATHCLIDRVCDGSIPLLASEAGIKLCIEKGASERTVLVETYHRKEAVGEIRDSRKTSRSGSRDRFGSCRGLRRFRRQLERSKHFVGIEGGQNIVDDAGRFDVRDGVALRPNESRCIGGVEH